MILAFFGFNESFAGPDGPGRSSRRTWRGFLKAPQRSTATRRPAATGTRRRQADELPQLESLRQIVLVSPIAHENLGRPRLSRRHEATTRTSKLYTEAMAQVAAKHKVRVRRSVHADSQKLMADGQRQTLTINGIHLNEHGDESLSPRCSTRRCSAPRPRSRQVDLAKLCEPKSTRRTCSSSTTTAPSTASTSTAAARTRSASSIFPPSSPSCGR